MNRWITCPVIRGPAMVARIGRYASACLYNVWLSSGASAWPNLCRLPAYVRFIGFCTFYRRKH